MNTLNNKSQKSTDFTDFQIPNKTFHFDRTSDKEAESIDSGLTQPEPITYKSQGSYCPVSDHKFAEWVAADVYDVVKSCLRGTMELEFYTPPYVPSVPEVPENEMGMIILHFRTLEAECDDFLIGFRFRKTDVRNNVVRRPFNIDSWRDDPDNPFASDICLANLDEAWRAICLLGLMLQIQRIEISYGAYS